MEERTLITITEYCSYHRHVAPDFVQALAAGGLISIVEEESTSIPYDQLSALEQYIHLHYDLDINLEGIEAIHHMLDRMIHLQDEVRSLKNRLAFYHAAD